MASLMANEQYQNFQNSHFVLLLTYLPLILVEGLLKWHKQQQEKNQTHLIDEVLSLPG